MGFVSLGKYGIFGFKLQPTASQADGFNQAATNTGWNWLMMNEKPSFKWTPNPESLDQADRNHHEHILMPTCECYQGSVGFHVTPGTLTDLLTWIQTRDVDNQGMYSTVYMHREHEAAGDEIMAMDVKVFSAAFTFAVGAPVTCTLDLVGRKDYESAKPVPSTDYDETDTSIIAPYIWKDCSFKFAAASTPATVVNDDIRNLTININNMVQDATDSMKFNGSANPYKMHNTAGVRCTGSFARDYASTDIYAAFRAAYQTGAWYDQSQFGSIIASMVAQGVTLTITINRLAPNDYDHGVLGSRVGIIEEGVDFIALGARQQADPTTPAATFPIFLAVG